MTIIRLENQLTGAIQPRITPILQAKMAPAKLLRKEGLRGGGQHRQSRVNRKALFK